MLGLVAPAVLFFIFFFRHVFVLFVTLFFFFIFFFFFFFFFFLWIMSGAVISSLWKRELHYENMPIQIYWKFYHEQMSIFR